MPYFANWTSTCLIPAPASFRIFYFSIEPIGIWWNLRVIICTKCLGLIRLLESVYIEWVYILYSVWKLLFIIFSNIFLSSLFFSFFQELNAYTLGSLKFSHSFISTFWGGVCVERRPFFLCVFGFSDTFFNSVWFFVYLFSLFFIWHIIIFICRSSI